MTLSPGQILNNRYRIVKLLGRGGFGAVYRAWDMQMEGPCVVKENLDVSPDFAKQFEQEAKLLFRLRHPNLPRVFDYFLIENLGQYLVMDYILGDDLGTLLEKTGGRLKLNSVKDWILQICDALIYLHTQNPPIIHRDIKPANIRISLQGQAVLVDFGIAKIINSKLTARGAKAFTPGFSPPEQYGSGTTDARSDVYALGATLYTSISNNVPTESVKRLLGERLPLPSQLSPEIDSQIESAILKAMELDPQSRFGSAVEFRKALTDERAIIKPVSKEKFFSISASPLRKIFGILADKPIAQINRLRFLLFLGLSTVFILLLGILFGLGSVISRNYQIASSTETIAPTTIPVTFTRVAGIISPTFTQGITASPTPSAGSMKISRVDGMEQIYIPAGEFQEGLSQSQQKILSAICPECDEGILKDNIFQPNTFLNSFWIDRTEVTNEKFARFVADTGFITTAEMMGDSNSWSFERQTYELTSGLSWFAPPSIPPERKPDKFPVKHVSWDDANAYCLWAGRQLPTGSEWEKAARGIDGRLFPWGNQVPNEDLLNFNKSRNGISPVGDFEAGASPYKVADLAGNLWEWTSDYAISEYVSSDNTNYRTNEVKGDLYQIRGGSWASNPASDLFEISTATKSWQRPNFRSDTIGFRCIEQPEIQPVLGTVAPITSPVSPSKPRFDLAFTSTRDGGFGVYLLNPNDDTDWRALPKVSGYETTWWPSYCGNSIFVEATERPSSSTDTGFPQWIFQTDITGSRYVPLQSPGLRPDRLAWPKCSPDASMLAVSINRRNSWQLLVINLHSNKKIFEIADVRFDLIGWASWNLKADKFAWLGISEGGRSFSVGTTTLVEPSRSQDLGISGKFPALSPDGKFLAYYRQSDLVLCVLDLVTKQDKFCQTWRHKLINGKDVSATAMWSKEGEWLYFSSAEDGDWDIYRIRNDGTDLQNVTRDWRSEEIMPALRW